MALLCMPIEIVALITESLDIEDVLSLRLTCRFLGYSLDDDAIARCALRKVKFSAEFGDASATGAYAQGLRRFIKRREAVRTASPYLVSIVAVANDYIFANGALCYTIGPASLRVLLLRGRVTRELEIDTRLLLLAAIPEAKENWSFRLRPLHYARGVLSCLCVRRKKCSRFHWLVVFHAETMCVVTARQISSANGIFVRNDERYLYYGERCVFGEDHERRYAICGFDMETSEWIFQRVVLWELMGKEMGATICFEIYDGYLYGLSSQTLFLPMEDKWNSFYYAFRFVLGEHSTAQVLPGPNSWRRGSREGTIDDRWSTLQLFQDEGSGKIYVCESHKEWPLGHARSRRTCYRKELVFPPTPAINTQRPPSEQWLEAVPSPAGWDSESHAEVRPPWSVHVDDDATTTDMTFFDSLMRSYNASCRSFVDLVEDAVSQQRPFGPRIRLRVVPRPHDGLEHAAAAAAQSDALAGSGPGPAASGTHVRLWPPEGDARYPDPLLEHIRWILDPLAPSEQVCWAADDRMFVYSPSNSTGTCLRPIILVSFDPSLCLPGLPKLRMEPSGRCHADLHPVAANMHMPTPYPVPLDGDVSITELNEVTSQKLAKTVGRWDRDMAPSHWARWTGALYRIIKGRDGGPCGFDFTR